MADIDKLAGELADFLIRSRADFKKGKYKKAEKELSAADHITWALEHGIVNHLKEIVKTFDKTIEKYKKEYNNDPFALPSAKGIMGAVTAVIMNNFFLLKKAALRLNKVDDHVLHSAVDIMMELKDRLAVYKAIINEEPDSRGLQGQKLFGSAKEARDHLLSTLKPFTDAVIRALEEERKEILVEKKQAEEKEKDKRKGFFHEPALRPA